MIAGTSTAMRLVLLDRHGAHALHGIVHGNGIGDRADLLGLEQRLVLHHRLAVDPPLAHRTAMACHEGGILQPGELARPREDGKVDEER